MNRGYSTEEAEDVPHYSSRRNRGRSHRRNGYPSGNGYPRQVTPELRPFLLDTWALAGTVMKRWHWLLLAGILFAALGTAYAYRTWRPYYIAVAQLIRFEQQNSAEFFKYQEISQPTFVTILESPDLLDKVSTNASPRITPDDLQGRLTVVPARESDVVSIMMIGDTEQEAVALANCYLTNAVTYFKQLQKEDAARDNEYLTNQLAEIQQEIKDRKQVLLGLPRVDASRPVGPSSLAESLLRAQAELDALLGKFTEAHPEVRSKQFEVTRLQRRLQESMTNAAPTLANSGPAALESDGEVLRGQIQMLENNRILLHTRQREAAQFSKNPPGYCRVFAMAQPKDVMFINTKMKTIFFGIIGGLGGVVLAIFLILGLELIDNRLKTAADLKRVTKLPVIATLGDLDRMHPSEQANWAFRTWTAMQSKLSLSANHGLVCGFTSSSGGQGRSTWIRLLAKAATQCGFRVLTIATLPSPPFMQEDVKEKKEREKENGEVKVNGKHREDSPFGAEPSMAVANNVLVTPGQVTEKLTGDHAEPQVHIPLPGWVWSLERRKQWQGALKQWRNIENIVILVELPPACDPEAVLLAENIPNIVWLADGTKADATESREQLQTLRDARCNLVGSVLNRAPATPEMKKRFSRWVGAWPLLLGICLVPQALRAQTNAPATPAPPARSAAVRAEPAFSASAMNYRGDWQRRLTLGPGDTLSISMYGEPTLQRLEVPIGPDGRLSYLQASDVLAAGLTVDELRARLDEELGKYYRSPRTMVTPVTYRSKKYYVLGKVVNRGAYALDRPITILEAVARAQGLETGLLENQTSFELADLQRSFVMRGNKRLDVNLEKLFLEGDLSQNVPLEPEDYLYFAAGNLKEVYVLGHVNTPGPAIWTPGMTVVGAIAARNGYTDKAFKSRVLVVRGSLNRPQTFVVDTWAALDARGLDFELKPKDIIYVHTRPFVRVEELLDLAATAFVQSATASWANQFIGPIITRPFLPQP